MDCNWIGIHPLAESIKEARWSFSVPSVFSVVSNQGKNP